jgi:hypothetical protein
MLLRKQCVITERRNKLIFVIRICQEISLYYNVSIHEHGIHTAVSRPVLGLRGPKLRLVVLKVGSYRALRSGR